MDLFLFFREAQNWFIIVFVQLLIKRRWFLWNVSEEREREGGGERSDDNDDLFIGTI